MLTGEIRSQIDAIWNAFWSGGISNPLEVIEQITYLLFIRRLDYLHTLEENKANRLKKPMARRIFPAGKDAKKRSYEDYRWSRFKQTAPEQMFETVRNEAFPFIKSLGSNGHDDPERTSTYTHHMKDALFMMPTPRVFVIRFWLLKKVN